MNMSCNMCMSLEFVFEWEARLARLAVVVAAAKSRDWSAAGRRMSDAFPVRGGPDTEQRHAESKAACAIAAAGAG